MNDKVIFLDLDGVLNMFSSPSGLFSLNKKRVGLLRNVVKQTDAKIVLSSTWRTEPHSMMQAHRRLGYGGLKIMSVTPNFHGRVPRGVEIACWLAEHRHLVSNFVIVDDTDDMLDWQRPNFVQTDGMVGLQPDDAMIMVEILNG